jgi:signal peptidase II
MKKREWAFAFAPLFLTWFLDRITKEWATQISGFNFYGPFGFVLHHNHGAILGLFSHLPALLRIVSLSTGGAFLLFIFAILQFLLPTRSLLLRSGLSFLIGGIIGNVTDRIIWGYVVDFLVIGSPDKFTPAFNLADALQWIGYGCIIIAFIKEGKNLWPVDNLRKSYWINLRFQLKYCFALMTVGLGLSIIAGTYSYTYLRVTLNEIRGNNPLLNDQFLIPFVITFGIVTLTFMFILFVVGMIISHRAAGPLYAFERFLNDKAEGKKAHLKLRAGDEFKELERLAEKLDKIL